MCEHLIAYDFNHLFLSAGEHINRSGELICWYPFSIFDHSSGYLVRICLCFGCYSLHSLVFPREACALVKVVPCCYSFFIFVFLVVNFTILSWAHVLKIGHIYSIVLIDFPFLCIVWIHSVNNNIDCRHHVEWDNT